MNRARLLVLLILGSNLNNNIFAINENPPKPIQEAVQSSSSANFTNLVIGTTIIGAATITSGWILYRLSKTPLYKASKRKISDFLSKITRPFRREWNNFSDDYPSTLALGLVAASHITAKGIGTVEPKAKELATTLANVITTITIQKQAKNLLFGSSETHAYREKEGTLLKDIIGGCPEEVTILIDYLKNPKEYEKIGIPFGQHILLYGLPGTGKTMLAHAIANEAKLPFFSVSSPSIVNAFLGRSARNIHDLFEKARKAAELEDAPFSIIFFDEFDAIGQARDHSGGLTTDSERQAVVNQLLTELDGFSQDKRVLVIAATNFATNLDAALTRNGRLSYKIEVKLPNHSIRRAILEYYLDKVRCTLSDEQKNNILNKIADETDKFSPADLKAIIDHSALIAANKRTGTVTDTILYEECQKIKKLVNGDEEKNALAQFMYS